MKTYRSRLGVGKRPPIYVPLGVARDCLLSMSKTSLAELVWDYAIRSVCEKIAHGPSGLDLVIKDILDTREILDHWLRSARAGE